MNNNIEVTEEDIFQFVCNPDSLDEMKRKYIISNKDKFVEMIHYYEYFKQNLSAEDISILEKKISEKYNNASETTILFPTLELMEQKPDRIRLAAASETLEKKSNSMSFADTEEKYLIRILDGEDKRILYFIPVNPLSKDEYIELKLLPDEIHFKILDISEPLEIDKQVDVKSIEITIKERSQMLI